MNKEVFALLKCDVVDSMGLPLEAIHFVHDAVLFAATGYGVEPDYPNWEGDGASVCFRGKDAATRAVLAAMDMVERVRLIPNHQVSLRAAVGVGEASAEADLTKESPPDFNLAGHTVGSTVCPPSAVCITEDVYFFLLHASPDLGKKFSYMGTTTRDDAPVFVSPAGKKPANPGGLRLVAGDHYKAALDIRAYYPRPPFSHLRFYTLPQFNFMGALDLMSVYTPLLVRRSLRGMGGLSEEEWGGHFPARALSEPKQESPEEFFHRSNIAPAEPFSNIFQRHRSLVILGDPGAGKSTLLRYLAIVTAGGRHVTQIMLEVGERLLPVHTTAFALLSMRRKHNDEDLSLIFARLLAPQVGNPPDTLGNAIAERAKAGEVLFLVDGLDEMTKAEDRLDAAKVIEELAFRYKESRYVVTSRIVGYPGLSLPCGEECLLEPLTLNQTHELARAFYVELYKSQKYDDSVARREGKVRGDSLMQALQERANLSLFAQNPLLLSLAALVHLQLGKLPQYRVKLYDVATETLVTAWATARHAMGIDPSSLRVVDYETEGRAVLLPLAFYMRQNCPGGLISKSDLFKQVAEHLPGQDNARVSDFLERLNKAGSLLVERGTGQWGFIHQSFEEYLAAKHLAAQDKEEWLLGKPLYQSRWQEVIKFTAGEIGVVQGRTVHAAKFIKEILNDTDDFRATDLKKNLLLAVQCAADTIYHDPEVEQDLVNALENELAKEIIPWEVMKNSLRYLRGTPLGALLVTRIERSSGLSNAKKRQILVVLGSLGAREAIHDILKTVREDKEGLVRDAAADALWQIEDKIGDTIVL